MRNAPISVGTYGESVAHLHDLLRGHGFELPASEVSRQFFGPLTRQAVQQFQQQNELPVTGILDERTATALQAVRGERPGATGAGPAASQHRPSAPVPPVPRQVFYRLGDCYLRFVEELWGRSWNIASESLRLAVREVGRQTVRPRTAEHLFRTMLNDYTNYVSGMVMALPLAAEATAARTDSARMMLRPEEDRATAEAAPRTVGIVHELPGRGEHQGTTPFITPARITDASQGWAAYVVPCKVAAEVLGSNADFVAPFDLGGDRTLLTVLGVDYRVSDFGQYREIALALTATPRSDPAGIPGVIFVGIAVSGEFSRDTAQAVWGLPKILCKDLSVIYHPDRVNFGLGSNRQHALSITFPRFGRGSFDGIPVLMYTRRDSADQRGSTPMRSLLSLSGRGEGLQIGGSVSVHLGSSNRAGCICRGSLQDCVCRVLEAFDVKDRLPAANGWTEHLSGTLDEPRLLHLSH
jgi:Putative peptidoglycan binding domain